MSFRVITPLVAPLAVLAGLLQTACHREGDATELYVQALTATTLPASPTNAKADDPAAAALGQRLFFDKRLSVDGTIACVSCHDPAHGFSDRRAFSVGVRGQTGGRHAMPLTTVAFQSFLLWDGRADSVWAQPLKAIENPKEMDLTRVELARVVATRYGEDYEAVFGALPTLDALPARGKPGMKAWDTLPAAVREDIDEVAANVGKALEAY
jgi:cytochrome c peroxidase